MTGQLSKNFHEVGIGPLSKILAVKLLTTRNKILALQSKSPVLQLTTPCMCFKINASTTHFNSTHSNVVGIWYSFFYLLLTIGVRILTNQGHTPSGPLLTLVRPHTPIALVGSLYLIGHVGGMSHNAKPHNATPYNTMPHNATPHNAKPHNATPHVSFCILLDFSKLKLFFFITVRF